MMRLKCQRVDQVTRKMLPKGICEGVKEIIKIIYVRSWFDIKYNII